MQAAAAEAVVCKYIPTSRPFKSKKTAAGRKLVVERTNERGKEKKKRERESTRV